MKAVIPVGEAWTRAIQTGVADPNPYDGIEAGKLDLWTYDHYHASTHGYYLEALVVFGTLTGRDPRSLGETECSGYELGLSRREVKALQQVAFDQLAISKAVTPATAAAAQAARSAAAAPEDPHAPIRDPPLVGGAAATGSRSRRAGSHRRQPLRHRRSFHPLVSIAPGDRAALHLRFAQAGKNYRYLPLDSPPSDEAWKLKGPSQP